MATVRNITINHVGGNQYAYNHCTFRQVRGDGQPSKLPSSFSLNDAPIDLLSVHFSGREEELTYIAKVLDEVRCDVPTRCVVHGMHGLGKSQLALQFAKSSFDQQRYSLVMWISATNIEKLNQGFANLLHLVSHPDRFRSEHSGRLTAARRWLEESGPTNWLLVLDNVDRETLGFLREHLPRKNGRGSILFTTRTESVAKALASVAGEQRAVFELQLPNTQDAARLLLEHFAHDGLDLSITHKAEEVVKCVGSLPLAIAQAASFMTESHKTLDDLLDLYHSEHKIDVRFFSTVLSVYSHFWVP
jgi:hypothetical protein